MAICPSWYIRANGSPAAQKNRNKAGPYNIESSSPTCLRHPAINDVVIVIRGQIHRHGNRGSGKLEEEEAKKTVVELIKYERAREPYCAESIYMLKEADVVLEGNRR